MKNRHSILVKFEDQNSTDGFHKHFNGRWLSSLEQDAIATRVAQVSLAEETPLPRYDECADDQILREALLLENESKEQITINKIIRHIPFNVSMPVGNDAIFAPEPGVQLTVLLRSHIQVWKCIDRVSLHVPVYHNIDIEGAPDLQLSLSKLATLKLASPDPRPSIPQVLRMRIDEYDNANKRTANQQLINASVADHSCIWTKAGNLNRGLSIVYSYKLLKEDTFDFTPPHVAARKRNKCAFL
ncbi:CLIP-associated protein [Tanacetum coccineum]